MPLRCVDEHGRTIEAPDCSEEEWESLRERARKERNLHMPCCPARAVLKTSKLRIPVETDHPFQSKPITDSIPSRSPIPADADH